MALTIEEKRTRKTASNKAWELQNPGRVNELARLRHRKIRLETINQYGGQCVCCGETNPLFLTIDHINGCAQEGIRYSRH